jgi:hypothetical protein
MEKKKTFRVAYAFSQKAAIYVDLNGWDALLSDTNQELEKDYDYGVIEFDTKAEADAYVKGVEDSNGWADPVAIRLNG